MANLRSCYRYWRSLGSDEATSGLVVSATGAITSRVFNGDAWRPMTSVVTSGVRKEARHDHRWSLEGPRCQNRRYRVHSPVPSSSNHKFASCVAHCTEAFAEIRATSPHFHSEQLRSYYCDYWHFHPRFMLFTQRFRGRILLQTSWVHHDCYSLVRVVSAGTSLSKVTAVYFIFCIYPQKRQTSLDQNRP